MLADIAADLRAVLPSEVTVEIRGDRWVRLRLNGRRLDLHRKGADALLRRLPPIAGAASIRMIEEELPHPRRRIASALRRLRRPVRQP